MIPLNPEDRIRDALVALVGEHGHEGTTLAAVLERADVDRAEFDRRFADFDSCCIEVWQELAREFRERTESAFAEGDGWREGMRRQAWEYCRFLVEDEDRAFFLVEIALAEELAQANRDAVMRRYVDFVDRGRFERPEAAAVERAQAEGVIGAIWEGVVTFVQAREFDQLAEAVPQMLYLTMVPYIGPAAAEEELRRGPDDVARFRRGEF